MKAKILLCIIVLIAAVFLSACQVEQSVTGDAARIPEPDFKTFTIQYQDEATEPVQPAKQVIPAYPRKEVVYIYVHDRYDDRYEFDRDNSYDRDFDHHVHDDRYNHVSDDYNRDHDRDYERDEN